MQNRDIRQLQEDLIAVLNKSPVMIEAKRFVVISVLGLVEKESDRAIIQEKYEETMQNTPMEEKGERNAESA